MIEDEIYDELTLARIGAHTSALNPPWILFPGAAARAYARKWKFLWKSLFLPLNFRHPSEKLGCMMISQSVNLDSDCKRGECSRGKCF